MNPARSQTVQGRMNIVSSQQIASDNAYRWLVAQLTRSGLVDSYEDDDDTAYTYDQAVAIIAFIAKNDLGRAEQVLDTLKALQQPDGTWYTAYRCGTRDVQQALQHVGPTLWVALAVAHYERKTGDRIRYRSMATRAIEWSLQFQHADGGINGGLDTDGNRLPWCSTEHNEDAYAAFTYFGYAAEAGTVKTYLDTHTWNHDEQRFNGGRNDTRDPMDVNSWGVIALGRNGTHPYAASLDYTLNHHRTTQSIAHGDATLTIDGFDFDSNRNDIWLEGQGEMAVAFKLAGRNDEADYFIGEIIKLQDADGGTGVRYSLKGTDNGYWTMLAAKSVSASGWLIFAVHNVNPLRP